MSTDKKNELKQKLAQSKQALEVVLNTLSPEQWEVKVFSEESNWTIKEIVAHLIDGETGMSIQVHKVRKGRETVPEGFDLDTWNNSLQKRWGEIPTPTTLMQKLAETRAKTLENLDTIKDEEWTLQGRHPSQGILTIEQYYLTIAGHEAIHTEDIRKAVDGG